MSATQVKCSECNKTVYPLEKVSIADGRNFHKACFKCFTCKSSLRPGQHFVHETKIYCKPHYAAAQGHSPKTETPRETPQEEPAPQPVEHTPTNTERNDHTSAALYAKLEAEHQKKQSDSKKDLADIEAQVQRALSHSRSSSSIKSLNLSAALSPRNNNTPSPSSGNTSTSSLTTTQEPPTLMEEVTALVSPRITAEEEDAFFKEQMDKLEQEEEARKKSKTKSHTPRKSEDHQRQKEEKLKALKEKKAQRIGQSNDVANVNLSAINNNGEVSPRQPETTIQVTSEDGQTATPTEQPAEGATRERKGSWALKPTSTTRRGSITSQGPVVVGTRSKSSDEHAQALEQAKANNNNENTSQNNTNTIQEVKHESTALVDPVPNVQKAISIVDKSMASVESFFSSLGVEKPHNVDTHSSANVNGSGGSEADQFIARVAQIKSTTEHDNAAQTNNDNTQHHDASQHNTLNSSEFDDFVNKVEEIKCGSKSNKHHNNNNNKPKAVPATTTINVSSDSGRDPHHYYWDFLKTTPNPEPASNHKSSHSDPHYYYWDFLSQANSKRRGSWAVKPTGTGRRGSVTSGEFRANNNNNNNSQSTQ